MAGALGVIVGVGASSVSMALSPPKMPHTAASPMPAASCSAASTPTQFAEQETGTCQGQGRGSAHLSWRDSVVHGYPSVSCGLAVHPEPGPVCVGGVGRGQQEGAHGRTWGVRVCTCMRHGHV